jgi:hypothetical protein
VYGQAGATHDLQAVAVGDVQLVGQVERHHLGVDQVVAVVADSGDAQETVSLAGATTSTPPACPMP